MNEYVPCKRRDPTAWEAIGRVRREEKERRKRKQQEKEREVDEERSEEDARIQGRRPRRTRGAGKAAL